MPDVIIRPPEPRDEEAWRRLWAGYLRFYRAEVPEAVTAGTWARLLADDPEIGGLLAEADGAVIGMCSFVFHASTWSDRPFCYLNDLYVDPQARGGGAARALIRGCEAAARARDCARLYWTTQEFNGPARSLYDTIVPRSSFIVYRMPLGG